MQCIFVVSEDMNFYSICLRGFVYVFYWIFFFSLFDSSSRYVLSFPNEAVVVLKFHHFVLFLLSIFTSTYFKGIFMFFL